LIDREDFKGMCERVARLTGRIDQETRDAYYDSLKGYDRELLFRAMKRVGREHGYYKFPTLAEIMDAIQDSHDGKRKDRVFCGLCNMTGIVLTESKGFDVAYRCSCPNGDKVSKKIRQFSEVAGRFQAPPDETRRPIVPLEAIDAIPKDLVFAEGVLVEKTCGRCWAPYRFEHRRRMTAKSLKEFHSESPALCDTCYKEQGKEMGLWK
jgi:hypothetical protein